MIIHWNGPPMGPYTRADLPGIIKATQNFHMFTRGWNDIAYNHSADRFGEIWEGRGFDIINAASGDTFANNNLSALELLVGQNEPFGADMQHGIVDFVEFMYERGVEHALYVHRDVTPTECPGDEITNWVHHVLPGLVDSPPPIVIHEEYMFEAFKVPNDNTVFIRNPANGKVLPLNDMVADSHDHMAVLNNMIAKGLCKPLMQYQDTGVDWDTNYAVGVMDGRVDPV